jgi:hypothetical protein
MPALTPLQQRLTGGDRRRLGGATEVAQQVLAHPDLLDEVVEAMDAADATLAARAAHVAFRVAEAAPERLQPYRGRLLALGIRDGWEVREQVSKILPRLRLDADEVEAAVDLFTGYLADRRALVRVCGLQGLFDLLARHQPALRPTVEVHFRDALTHSSAAVRARARLLLARLDGA